MTNTFVAEQTVNGMTIYPQREGKSGNYLRLSAPRLLGLDPINGGGRLVVIQAMNSTELRSMITTQWDESFNTVRIAMESSEAYLDLQVNGTDLRRPTVSISTDISDSVGILDVAKGQYQGSEISISQSLIRQMVQDFSLLSPLAQHLAQPVSGEGPGGLTVVFQQSGGGGGKDCDKKRAGGWLIAGLELAGSLVLGAAAAAATGGAIVVAGLVIGALTGSAKAGKDAADTENEHKKCKEAT
jgi:hypothetical protein